MPQKPLSAEYFDGSYADQAATRVVAEIMNRHMGFPPDTRAGTVPGEAIPELAEALRLRANLGAGLRQAGFTDVEVRDRPSWLAREHALWEETVTLDPGNDPALRSLHTEGQKSLQWTALLRRVLAVATNPR